ncbi:MAG: hypothetical protein ABIO75_08425 [Thermomonas sp.]
MIQRPPQPPKLPRSLDAEERALARALPRLHGRTAPGPDLDASILAAAQAAVRRASSSHTLTRPRIRWIAPASLAASMVLAVGIAWQLRPLPPLETTQSTVQSDTADIVAVQMIEPAPYDKAAPMVPSKSAPAESTAAARPLADPPIINSQDHSPSAGVQRVQTPTPLSPPPAMPASTPPSAFPVPAPAAPPHPAAAMTAETAPRATSAVSSSAGAAAAAASSTNALERNAASASAAKASVADSAQQAATKALAPQPRNEAARAADARFVDDPGEDVPPATVDSPIVRDAWLHRIGELLEQGKRQEAKASLAEFRRRYPAAVLPPKLHALEIEP